MKKITHILFATALLISTSACNDSTPKVYEVATIDSGARFCEGTTENNDNIYFSNFGGESLNPLNLDGKGYIMKVIGNNSEILIPANGTLNAPKGMDTEDDYLYIADVGCIVVYNLKDSTLTPLKLELPEGNVFVNDIAIEDDIAYISVTNTDKIFKLDISNPTSLTKEMIVEHTTIPGANGIVIEDEKMYVASYPADGVTTDKNTIYVVENIAAPKVEKLISRPGQYDGLALSDKKDRLYFTNWVDGEVGYIVLDTKEVVIMDINYTFAGPADMIYEDGKLYIPDLPNSKIVIIDVE